jgi:hypothetical protein
MYSRFEPTICWLMISLSRRTCESGVKYSMKSESAWMRGMPISATAPTNAPVARMA